jgi:hypothetical protein
MPHWLFLPYADFIVRVLLPVMHVWIIQLKFVWIYPFILMQLYFLNAKWWEFVYRIPSCFVKHGFNKSVWICLFVEMQFQCIPYIHLFQEVWKWELFNWMLQYVFSYETYGFYHCWHFLYSGEVCWELLSHISFNKFGSGSFFLHGCLIDFTCCVHIFHL